ncbi:MAG: iron hydrogenase small subunit [Deltaproteobacteria bacterium]|nr:iron hydrogenase small subunit [Deltaproteobacteria bacterium]
MFQIQVNDKNVDAKDGEMLLATLKRAGIHVPTLCNMADMLPTGACRLCVVEVEGAPNLVPSCAFPVREGMKVKTHSLRAVRARKTIVELLLANHPDDCLYCARNNNCELQSLAENLGVRQRRYIGNKKERKIDASSPSIVRDPAKCILCGKCVRVCEEVQGVSALDFVGRGSKTEVSTVFNQGLNVSSCIACGQCIMVCPTGALTEQSNFRALLDAIGKPDKRVLVQIAPAVSVTLGELFGVKPGVDIAGVLNAALRRLGVDRVFDTAFSADLTIMEEGSELVQRLTLGGTLPMLTSCSPGWIKFMESFYPELLPHLSTCKSPQQMLGAVLKSFYAQRENIAPEQIFSVSIMPCTAKKFEAGRPEMLNDELADVDLVLTTRELARIIRMRGIDLNSLEPEPADTPFGERSSAGKLFGATGGVMEAALRSVHYLITGKEIETPKITPIRGLNGIKQAEVAIADTKLKVAVVSGLSNARIILDEIRKGNSPYHFVEVMTCPGGCIAGGGQPIGANVDAIRARMQALYKIDREAKLRTSHQNASVQRLYDEYLGKPLSEKSHHLLHTHYTPREVVK